MAQVLVNFRIDEEVKRDMEQACREMGLSMSTAFSIFAKKVGREKRIPFEIAVEPSVPEPFRRPRPAGRGPEPEEGALWSAGMQKRMEQLYASIRQSLTAIHTAIPASITGLTMERIRMLCGYELKDKTAAAARAAGTMFSGSHAELLRRKDLSLLDEYICGLAAAAQELAELERTLIPAMKAGRGDKAGEFEPYEQRLAAVSQMLDKFPDLIQHFLASTACDSGVRMVQARLQQAARPVETAYVLTALENLEAQLLRCYDFLDGPVKARLESDYLPTLEHTLQTLGQAEQDGEDAAGKAALCLRAVNVLSQVISDARQVRREWDARGLEAEVLALERMAALRGDISGGMKPEA